MDIISTTLARIPLFRHCTEEEIAYLRTICRTMQAGAGANIDLKNIDSLNIIVKGMLEIDALGKNDILYLAPGSFFGEIPFTDNVHRGRVRAIADTTLIVFEKEQIVKFFLIYYKALRGYLRAVGKMGFTVTDVGKKYFGGQRRVISVCGRGTKTGRSLLSAILGTALSKKGPTIVLDCSYGGESLFTLFNARVTSPLSHKEVNGQYSESQIFDRIEKVGENLHLVNVSFGSKVRGEPDILSPLLFMLSREYRYIVMDVSDEDDNLRSRAFALSDVIYALMKSKKDMPALYRLFEREVDGAQRVYYVLNEYYSGAVRDMAGGFILEKLELPRRESLVERIESLFERDYPGLKSVIESVQVKRRGLVIESLFFDAVFLSGFFSALAGSGRSFDVIYTSSLSYIMLALYQLSADQAEFGKNVSSVFSEDRINRFLDITFPDECVFKNGGIVKAAQDICGAARLEMFTSCPVALLNNDRENRRKIMSAGLLRDAFSASFLVYPLFQPLSIAGRDYTSGFPGNRVAVEDLFRTDIDHLTYLAVQNSQNFELRKDRVLPFFRKYVAFLENSAVNPDKVNTLADASHILEVTEKSLDMKRIFSETERASQVFFETPAQ
jgi:hypothetical protein